MAKGRTTNEYPWAHDAFSVVGHHAKEHPDALALTGMGRSWTYRELKAQAESVAGELAALCSEPGARIAVVANNHPLTCLVYLAAARAGMVVSLLNSMFKEPELATVLTKLAPQVVIFDAAHRAVVNAALVGASLSSSLVTLESDGEASLPSVEEWTSGPPFGAQEGPQEQEFAEISWTSGTTSSPKGVMLTHDAVLFRAEREVALFQLTSADAAAVITPLFHQSGIRDTVLVMWVCGGRAIVLPRFDLPTFWVDMVKERITYLCMVETILLMLDRNPPCAQECENSLRVVLAAGDPELVRRCERRFGFRVVQVWGMTETGVTTGVKQTLSMDEVNALRNWGNGAPLAGWPTSEDTKIRLMVDGKAVTEEGKPGEIQVSSRFLFSKYYEDINATSSAFDGPWFKTGDLGMFGPSGALYFLDRLKDVIRRGGENIASKQVEDVLASHPKVSRAAVIPVADPLFVQEVKAVIIAKAHVSPEELWSWCEKRLAYYKVPRYIEFRDELPLNSSGRVQKHVLSQGAPSGSYTVFDRRAVKVTA